MSDTAQLSSMPLGSDARAAQADEQQGRYGLTATEQAQISREFGSALHFDDVLLTRACALGREAAWERFLGLYREKLCRFAAGIARERMAGRELADSLYADLFGTRLAIDGSRISKLNSYRGTGSLEGWLKTVLAQEYVNRVRQTRKLAPWEAEAADDRLAFEDTFAHCLDMLTDATDQALAALEDEDRLLLQLCYLDERSFAEIGRMLRRHESSVARRLDKLLSRLRKGIVRALRAQGISKSAAEELLRSDVRDLNVDVRERLRRTRQQEDQEDLAAVLPE